MFAAAFLLTDATSVIALALTFAIVIAELWLRVRDAAVVTLGRLVPTECVGEIDRAYVSEVRRAA